MATIREKLGKRIRQLRKKQGLTQEKLAELARIDYTYLNLIEAGKRNPTISLIDKLARALGVKPKDLIP